MTSAAWFVVQTESQREALARERLDGQGFMTYLPRTQIDGRVAPLFPSYLFVSAVERWSPINRTIGVRGLLMAGVVPASVPHPVIAEIWHRENPQGLIPSPARRRYGQRLTVLHGPFRDHLAVYLGTAGRDRERVMLQLLGRMVAMSLPVRDLR